MREVAKFFLLVALVLPYVGCLVFSGDVKKLAKERDRAVLRWKKAQVVLEVYADPSSWKSEDIDELPVMASDRGFIARTFIETMKAGEYDE